MWISLLKRVGRLLDRAVEVAIMAMSFGLIMRLLDIELTIRVAQ